MSTYTVHTYADVGDDFVKLEADVQVGAYMAGDAPEAEVLSLVRLDTGEDVSSLLKSDPTLAKELRGEAVEAYWQDMGEGE